MPTSFASFSTAATAALRAWASVIFSTPATPIAVAMAR